MHSSQIGRNLFETFNYFLASLIINFLRGSLCKKKCNNRGVVKINLVEAAKIVEQVKPDVIDINFGCPVKKVANKGAGSCDVK